MVTPATSTLSLSLLTDLCVHLVEKYVIYSALLIYSSLPARPGVVRSCGCQLGAFTCSQLVHQ